MIMTAGDPIFGVNLPLGGREPSFPNPSANLVGVGGIAAAMSCGLIVIRLLCNFSALCAVAVLLRPFLLLYQKQEVCKWNM